MPENLTYYDFTHLDNFLTKCVRPEALSDHLEDLCLVLVSYICRTSNARSEEMLELYAVLKDLCYEFEQIEVRHEKDEKAATHPNPNETA